MPSAFWTLALETSIISNTLKAKKVAVLTPYKIPKNK
jgi:hypothetical protein